jgi:hypothetical protein
MSSPPAPSGAAIASALGLPSELLELLNQVYSNYSIFTTMVFDIPFQMGMDVESLVQEPEHVYIEQLLEFTQGLPDPVQRPVDVRDSSAFGSFLGSASHGYFKKYGLLSWWCYHFILI